MENGVAELAWPAGNETFTARASDGLSVGQQAWLALRPEKVRISLNKPTEPCNTIPGKVIDVGYLGSISHYHVRVASGQTVTALRANSAQTVETNIKWDDDVWLEWPQDGGMVLTS